MCFLDHSFGYNFLVFWFFAKSMLKFRAKKMLFRLILKYSSFNYFSLRKVHFSRHRKWPGRKAIILWEDQHLKGFRGEFSVLLSSAEVNTKECLFDKSPWPHNCQISFSSLKNKALDSEDIFNDTQSRASIHSKYFLLSSELSLFIFRSTCPLNLQEIFYKLKWLYVFYLRHCIV